MRYVADLVVIAVAGTVFCDTAACAEPFSASNAVKYTWVQVAPPNIGVVRAITADSICPKIRFDRSIARMSERARPDSDFNVLTCEATIPAGTQRIEIAGKTLRAPPLHPKRIAIIGDTGCRLK